MIKIVTDSSVTLSQDVIEKYGITVVPLSVMIDGTLYSDNELKPEGQFLQLMTASKNLPKTSQPPVGLFAETYERLVAEGATEIIAIHLAGSLSGTIEASRQGALLSGAPVTVLDSQVADQALAFQVVKAAELVQAGATADEIISAVTSLKDQTELYIGVSTLENLVKGGRISRVSGLLGSLLNIRVMLEMKQGQLSPLVKGRGSKTFTRWFAQFKENLSAKTVTHLAMSYAGDDTLVRDMAEQLAELVSVPITVMETGSVIQTHTGPGAFAIMVAYEN